MPEARLRSPRRKHPCTVSIAEGDYSHDTAYKVRVGQISLASLFA